MTPFVIPTIFTAIDRLSAPVLRMQRAMTGMTVIAGTAGAALQRSLRAISASCMEVAASAGMIGIALAIPLGLAGKAAMDFEKQMTNVATLMDTSRESVSMFSDQLLAMAAKMPVATHDLTESLYQIHSEGYKGAQALDILSESAKLSVTGLSTATEAAKSMATAIRLFGKEGLTTNQIADVFFKTVATGRTEMEAINESFGDNAALVAMAGGKFVEFQAATAAMTNAGLTASMAQTAFAQASLAMIKPTGEMITILQALGYAGADAGKQLIAAKGGIVPAMEAIGAVAGKAGDNIAKAFGRKQGLVAFGLLTSEVKEQFQQDIAIMQNGANQINDAYSKQMGTTAAQTQVAANNIHILAIRIGEALLPAITSLALAIASMLKPLADFAHHHTTITKAIVYGTAAFAVFALTVAAGAFVIGTITKAIWLWNLRIKAIDFTMGFFNTLLKVSNAELVGSAAGARGAGAAMSIMNTTAQGLLFTLGKLAAVTLVLYGLWKLFDKKNNAEARMNAVLAHLPAGVDKDKFSDQFQDILQPGHISIAKRLSGVKDYYPQETYDSLAKKYFDEPMRVQDSMLNSPTLLTDATAGSGSADSSNNNITVTIDNKTGNKVIVGNTGAIPVKIAQTGMYSKGNDD